MGLTNLPHIQYPERLAESLIDHGPAIFNDEIDKLEKILVLQNCYNVRMNTFQ